MHLTPDQEIFWQHGSFKLNATIAFTWGLMLALAIGSKLVTRKLSMGLERSPWQNLLEIIVLGIEHFNVAMSAGAGEIQLTYPSQRGGLRFHALDRCQQPARLVASDSWKLLDDFRTVQFSSDSPSGGYALPDSAFGLSTFVVATYMAWTEPRASDYTNARHISLNVDSDDMTRSGIHMK